MWSSGLLDHVCLLTQRCEDLANASVWVLTGHSLLQAPDGFESAVGFAEAHLKALLQKCLDHHVHVVLDLGLHDRWQPTDGSNGLKNNRWLLGWRDHKLSDAGWSH